MASDLAVAPTASRWRSWTPRPVSTSSSAVRPAPGRRPRSATCSMGSRIAARSSSWTARPRRACAGPSRPSRRAWSGPSAATSSGTRSAAIRPASRPKCWRPSRSAPTALRADADDSERRSRREDLRDDEVAGGERGQRGRAPRERSHAARLARRRRAGAPRASRAGSASSRSGGRRRRGRLRSGGPRSPRARRPTRWGRPRAARPAAGRTAQPWS